MRLIFSPAHWFMYISIMAEESQSAIQRPEPTNRLNWREGPHPWIEFNRPLTEEEHLELALFRSQETLRIEERVRRARFEEDMEMRRMMFEQAEADSRLDTHYIFARQLWVPH